MEVPSVDIVSGIAEKVVLKFEKVDCDIVNREEIADGDGVEREVVERVGIVPPLDDDSEDIVLDIPETVSVNVESKLVLEVLETEDSDEGVAMDV